MLTRETAPGGKTHRRRGEAGPRRRSQAEARAFVGDLQVHAPKDIDRAKPRASRASGGHASWDSGSRLNHSFIGVPLLASNRSPWPSATRSSTRLRGSLTTSWPRTNIAKIFLR